MSIQDELNQIKNAVYGADVRDAIHDSIKKTYDDASVNGNANMEVEMARGTHPNLRSRLEEVDNEQQQTTAQLAQTATKTELSATNQSIANFNDRVDQIITTPVDGDITQQEIIDSRQGEESLGANLSKIKSDLKPLMKIKNELDNGDFSNGTKGWVADNVTLGEGYVNLTSVNGSLISNRLMQEFDSTGDIFYANVLWRKNGAQSNSGLVVALNESANGTLLITNGASSGTEDFVTQSVRFTTPTTDTHIGIRGRSATHSINVDVKYLLLINLTKEFGFGNEPSKEEMDNFIEKYGGYANEYTSKVLTKLISNEVTNNETEPETSENSLIAKYYDMEKTRVINKVLDDIKSPTNSVFGLIADQQLNSDREGSLLDNYTNINHLSNELPVNFIANLGDFFNGETPKGPSINFLKKITKKVVSTSPVPYFITKGNHDDNSLYMQNNGNLFKDMITDLEWYTHVIKYFERYPQLVFDEENRMGGYCYYDDPSSKVRYIFMNIQESPSIENPDGTAKYTAMENPAFSDKQIQWLAHKAFNFTDKTDKEEWAVVGMIHRLTTAANNFIQLRKILEGFMNGTPVSSTTVHEDYGSVLNVDYTEQGPMEFITFICGHTHKDVDFQMMAEGYHQFSVDASSTYTKSGRTRTPGTDTQDCFYMVVLDRENKLIKLTNFGGGVDRLMDYNDYTPKEI